MRLPNGYGGISKLAGNRRNPYRVRITKEWQVVDGKSKQIYETLGYYPTRKAAMIALAEYNKSPCDLANRKITFDSCYQSWSQKHFQQYPIAAASLRAAYKKCDAIKNMPMREIRLRHMQAIMDSISSLSVSAQTNLKTVFIKTFRYALENDIISKDYSHYVTIIQTPVRQDLKHKFFTAEEIRKVFDNINWSAAIPVKRNVFVKFKLADTVLLLLYTGMRIGEMLNLRCRDVNIAARAIAVHGTKTKAAERIIPIHKDLLPYLAKRLEESCEYLIEKLPGERFSRFTYVNYFFQPFMQLIGAEHTPHATRHTFISLMDKCGVSTESVVLKRIAGHADNTITEHYTHKTLPELIAAIDKLKLI